MNNLKIFDPIIDSFSKLGEVKNIKIIRGVNNGVISGLPSHLYNMICFGDMNKTLISTLKENKILFTCIAEAKLEPLQFESFCINNGLIKGDLRLIQRYDNLYSFCYESKNNIQVIKVLNEKDLLIFDRISSLSFQHPLGLAFKFLYAFLGTNTLEMFIAYFNDNPVGCGILVTTKEASLHRGGVLPQYRNHGIGSEITKYRLNAAKNKGYTNIYSGNMPSSVSYFQKLGFKAFGAIQIYIYK
jgi:hypothetical protein